MEAEAHRKERMKRSHRKLLDGNRRGQPWLRIRSLFRDRGKDCQSYHVTNPTTKVLIVRETQLSVNNLNFKRARFQVIFDGHVF